MRLRVTSDLHLPHHKDMGLSFAKDFAEKSRAQDVLVLAGDIVDSLTRNSAKIEEILKILQGEHRDVIWVLGNHEFYHSGYDQTLDEARRLSDKLGWKLLENETCITIDKNKFCGTTGWFPYNSGNHLYEHWMTDFGIIRGSQYLYDQNEKAKEFLLNTVNQGDIVVTHHLPCYECVSYQYAGSPLNRFFVGEFGEIFEQSPALWVYGHTHDKKDQMIKNTRTVANPLGYPGEKGAFSDLWIDLP